MAPMFENLKSQSRTVRNFQLQIILTVHLDRSPPLDLTTSFSTLNPLPPEFQIPTPTLHFSLLPRRIPAVESSPKPFVPLLQRITECRSSRTRRAQSRAGLGSMTIPRWTPRHRSAALQLFRNLRRKRILRSLLRQFGVSVIGMGTKGEPLAVSDRRARVSTSVRTPRSGRITMFR